MATSKPRGSKRSSGTSYSSTVTTVVFVALCVLGVWVLASNSFSPPKSTYRTADKVPQQITSVSQTHHSKHNTKKDDHLVPEDVPGELPDDVIKPVEPSEKDASTSDDADASNNESVGGGNDKEETEVLDDQGKEHVEEQENQIAYETQVAQETGTQSQQDERMKEENRQFESKKVKNGDDHASKQTQDLEDPRVQHRSHFDDTSTVGQNQFSDKGDNQQQEDSQMQQKQREKQSKKDPNGAISDDQIQHDEASINSVEDGSDLKESNESNTKETNQDINSQENNQELTKKNDDNTFPNGENTEIPKESVESKKAWFTQADQSVNQKERRKTGSNEKDSSIYGYTWQLCNVSADADYIPCLDNLKAIAKIHNMKHYQHRERHCPEESPTCLVPLPKGYKTPIMWPQSRDKIWYHNVPHTLLAKVKGHQNWVKVTGEFLTFPGGGTQFIHGALHYIDFIQEAVPNIAWGKRTRVILDVGCGVASFGGYLFERDVIAMSFAPKDEHEAQVQFALERGIPAISAVMGSQRLPFPSSVFDIVHCARCRVPWHADGGTLLLELNRVLRPGGYFVWSATPVYQTLEEDVMIWKAMSNLTAAMCWEVVTIRKDRLNSIGAAIFQKPTSNNCYEKRGQSEPQMCKDDDDPNAAWYVPLQPCMHRVPIEKDKRGSQWPKEWPKRLQIPPYWLNKSQMGIYGKPAPDDFASDYEHWKKVVTKSYMSGLGISWSNVRNVMDMRAVYGGFAAALKDLKVWVMNVVNVDSPDTLPIIYERGLFGIYHDWCESFSTYPRTYDLLHADHLFTKLKKRCKLVGVMAEIDRIVRPGGKLIVRDDSSTVGEVENLLKSLHWEVHLTFSKNQEGILSAQKSDWRPDSYTAPS
ncbi:probable methyltransferase PMT27 [Primulina huaijiensis]|uniref:probable methyltransferase PMT27 n=1 Tax=Primulina huaijiensis TaxID=1492673 RepID=UPI003CC6EF22